MIGFVVLIIFVSISLVAIRLDRDMYPPDDWHK
jgi:hypothetical protein